MSGCSYICGKFGFFMIYDAVFLDILIVFLIKSSFAFLSLITKKVPVMYGEIDMT